MCCLQLYSGFWALPWGPRSARVFGFGILILPLRPGKGPAAHFGLRMSFQTVNS